MKVDGRSHRTLLPISDMDFCAIQSTLAPQPAMTVAAWEKEGHGFRYFSPLPHLFDYLSVQPSEERRPPNERAHGPFTTPDGIQEGNRERSGDCGQPSCCASRDLPEATAADTVCREPRARACAANTEEAWPRRPLPGHGRQEVDRRLANVGADQAPIRGGPSTFVRQRPASPRSEEGAQAGSTAATSAVRECSIATPVKGWEYPRRTHAESALVGSWAIRLLAYVGVFRPLPSHPEDAPATARARTPAARAEVPR
jgi:hypothetical protein